MICERQRIDLFFVQIIAATFNETTANAQLYATENSLTVTIENSTNRCA